MESPRQTSNSGTVSPLAYERGGAEAIPGVERSGKYLVVRRGGDLSRYCLKCGRPSAEKPIRKCLFDGSSFRSTGGGSGSGGGMIIAIIQLILLIFYLFMLVAEFWASRSRVVIFGLCDAHLRQRRTFRLVAGLIFAVGTIALIEGIWLATSSRGRVSDLEMFLRIACFVGGPVLWIIALFVGMRAPGVSLQREASGYLLLKGAGEAFLSGQTEVPPTHPTFAPSRKTKTKKK